MGGGRLATARLDPAEIRGRDTADRPTAAAIRGGLGNATNTAFLAMVTDPGYRGSGKDPTAAGAHSRTIRFAPVKPGAALGE
jgi:hypothetical protein